MKNFNNIFKILLIATLLPSITSAIEIQNLSQAVDVAGKQRMFTQRMLKDYAMVGMGNSFGKPEDDLKKVMNSFEEHMESLYQFTKDEATKKSIEEAKTLWAPIKQKLTITPTKESAGKLQEDLEALLKVADNATKLFAKQTGKKSGEIINISGRQRMLSQRMAGLYMLKVWGIDDPQFTKKMSDAMDLFKTSLQILSKYESNTPEISKLLAKVKRSFMFFEIMNKSSSKFIPSLIYKKSNDMLKNMNSATGLYAALETN